MRAPYRVDFEIVHRNDDNTRIVGIFVFRVNKVIYFAPVFFINGSIKGTDLFYRHNTKSFVPLNEDWLEYLISLSETQEGETVPPSERINTRRQINLQSIVNPPNSMGGGYKYAGVDVVDPDEVKRLAHEAWEGMKSAAITDLPGESLLRKFIVNDGGFSAIRKIATAAQEDPEFARALFLGSAPENYMPELEPIKSAAAAPEPLLTLHTRVLLNPACKSASVHDINQGYAIEDKRAGDLLNSDIADASSRDLQSITVPGAVRENIADEILTKAASDSRHLFLYQPAEILAKKVAHNLRFPQFPEFYETMNSDYNVQEQPQSRIAVQADRDMPYIERHRIGDKVTHTAENMDTTSPTQLYQLSKERGVGKMFEHGVVGALTNTYDSAALIETYTPALLDGLDRIGRILFLFYWKPEDFAQAFGSDDQSQLENKLISNFKSFGDLTLELLQKNKQRAPGSNSLA